MPLVRPVVFPLFGIVDGKCACGNESCSRIGKHPAVAWGELVEGSPVPRPEEGAGYGIKTGARPRGSDVVVVDLDGEAAIEEWGKLDTDSDLTYTVQTPRGWHLYFEHPGFPVRNSASELAPGIDIRGDGGFVVGAGSPHRSGGAYEEPADLDVIPLPSWLRAWLEARRLPDIAPVETYPGDVTDPAELEYRKGLFRSYLETAPPCVAFGGGDHQLFQVVQFGAYDLALPTEIVLDLIAEVYDPRCEPPWGDELAGRVRHKCRSAKTASTRPRREPPPASMADWFSGVAPQTPVHAPVPVPAPVPAVSKPDGILWGVWDEQIEPPSWLVEGLIPVGTVGGLVAHGSSLKTWTALSLGAAVAQGRPWLETYVTKKGRVLVLDYESGDYELRRRMRLLDGGKIESLGAWPMPPLRIDDETLWKKLATIADLSLIIIDSLAAGAMGVDENDANAAAPLHFAGRFAEETGCAVAVIHHSKKDDGGDARKAVRGSTAIFAAFDWCYAFENIEETTTYRRMQMISIKPCMGSKPMPVPLELTDDGLRLFASNRPTGNNGSDISIRDNIRNKLEQYGVIGSKNKLADLVGGRKQRVFTELDELVATGEVLKGSAAGMYELDAPHKRIDRVKRAIKASPLMATVSEVARAAKVTTDVVDSMLRDGVIFRSAEGKYLVV
jgi:hypothetical protein